MRKETFRVFFTGAWIYTGMSEIKQFSNGSYSDFHGRIYRASGNVLKSEPAIFDYLCKREDDGTLSWDMCELVSNKEFKNQKPRESHKGKGIKGAYVPHISLMSSGGFMRVWELPLSMYMQDLKAIDYERWGPIGENHDPLNLPVKWRTDIINTRSYKGGKS